MQQILKKLKSESEKSEVEISESKNCDCWTLIPENVLVHIFKYLSAREILNCSECCKRWNYVSRDTLLWRSKFREDFKIAKGIKIKPSELIVCWVNSDKIKLRIY